LASRKVIRGILVDWIDQYLKYTSLQEAPEIFHFWSAAAIISSVLNRRVYLPRIAANGVVYYTNFPGQLSPILIAGAGKAKKSTAINIAKQFMKEAGVKVFDGKITPERLLSKLSQIQPKSIMTAIASELSAFLGKQSYNDGMIDILNKLADCDDHPYETQQKTYDLGSNICFTLYAGSTPMNLSRAIPPQAQEHGWLSRYVFVYSDRSGKIEDLANDEEDLDPLFVKESKQQKDELVIFLRSLNTLSGPIRWGASAGWMKKRYREYMESSNSEGEGWPQRRTDHLVRLAMDLHFSKGSRTMTMDQIDLEKAEHYISLAEKDMSKCFTFIGQHANADQQEKVLKVLREAPITKVKDLLFRTARYFPNPGEIRNTLIMMEQAGIIGNVGNPGDAALYTIIKEPY
jgi:hypothetical protein